MDNPEHKPDFKQISQPKPVKKMAPMAPREISDELHREEEKTDEAKPMTFPAEGKIPGARRLDKTDMDKEKQFRLQDEIEKMQGEMNKQIEIISRLWAREKNQTKAEQQKERVRAKFEPRLAELQNKLKEEFGERENVENLLPQLQEQTRKSEEKRIKTETAKKIVAKEAAEDKNVRLQKIPVTPDLQAVRKKAAQKEIEDAYKKLVDAEDALAEAEKNRPGAFSRFLGRFRIGKPSAEETSYRQAFYDKNTTPEELKKLETAAIEAMTYKPLAAEMTYQQALRVAEEAKKNVDATEKAILNSGIYLRSEKPARRRTMRMGAETSTGRTSLRFPVVDTRKAAEVKPRPETAPARRPVVQAGEYEIKFKPETAPKSAPRKVEVPRQTVETKRQATPEAMPEEIANTQKSLDNLIKSVSFTYPEHRQLVLQNAAFQENLTDNGFKGDLPTLKKTITETLSQLAQGLKLGRAEVIAPLAQLMPQKNKRRSATAMENFRHYLALKDLEQSISTLK